MLTLGAALQQGTALLTKGSIGAPRLTSEVLLAHALRRDRSYLYAHPEQELREVEWIHYGRYLHERLKGKPTQYITRRQEFYGRLFAVSPAVLIPRPETEHLVEAAIPLVREGGLVVDVGTGSGAIAVTLALESRAKVLAVDLSSEALLVARGNAQRLGASVQFCCGDGLSSCRSNCLDLVVSNPPYIALSDRPGLQTEVREWEPELALFAGPTGLEFYERLIPEAARALKRGGSVVWEVGAGQSQAVAEMFGEGWEAAVIEKDLAGIERVLQAQKR